MLAVLTAAAFYCGARSQIAPPSARSSSPVWIRGLTCATDTATTAGVFIAWRVAAGFSASGVIPIGVALIDHAPYHRRGHALGWLFGSMALGSTAGVLAEPGIG